MLKLSESLRSKILEDIEYWSLKWGGSTVKTRPKKGSEMAKALPIRLNVKIAQRLLRDAGYDAQLTSTGQNLLVSGGPLRYTAALMVMRDKVAGLRVYGFLARAEKDL